MCLCDLFLTLYSGPTALPEKVLSFVYSTAFFHFSPQRTVLQFGDFLSHPYSTVSSAHFQIFWLSVLPLWLCTFVKSMLKAKFCDPGMASISSPDKSFPGCLQHWDACKIFQETLRPRGLCLCVYLSTYSYFVLLETINLLVWDHTLNFVVQIVPGKRKKEWHSRWLKFLNVPSRSMKLRTPNLPISCTYWGHPTSPA